MTQQDSKRQVPATPPEHTVKRRVLREYATKYGLRILVETGTYKGDMVEAMRGHFDHIYSIELSDTLHRECRTRFHGIKGIHLIHGDSGVELGKLMKRIQQPALFWLDGHYSGKITARGLKDTPIREELEHIFNADTLPHVIIIDDARCFGTIPGYPTVQELCDYIRSKRPDAGIDIQNDSIRITPASIPSRQIDPQGTCEEQRCPIEAIQAQIDPYLFKIGHLPRQGTVCVRKMDPAVLVNTDRFDLPAKIIFARFNRSKLSSDWGKALYLAHINAFNGFHEEDGSKSGPEAFVSHFEGLLDSIASRGFDPQQSLIAVGSNNSLIGGSHRLAAAYACGTDIHAAVLDSVAKPYDYRTFLARGLERKYADAMAYEYCKTRKNTFIVSVFPSAEGKDEQVEAILRNYVNIFYRKDVRLYNHGPHLLIKQMYRGESWLGNGSNRFKGAKSKADKCFQKPGAVRVFLVETQNAAVLRQCKEEIRALFKIDNHSVHINDSYAETLRLAQIYFNDNSIHFLNHAEVNYYERFSTLLEEYRTLLEHSGADNDCFCIDGSSVMAAYGIREARDIDYLHYGFDHVKYKDEQLIGSHNDEMKYHTRTLDDIIFNPEHHFYYEGLKFASLATLSAMKAKRGEVKDKKDVALMAPLLGSRTANAQIHPAPKAPKIVGLMAARNEEHTIEQGVRLLSQFTDAIVYLDDCSTDNTLSIVRRIAAQCRIEHIIAKDRWVRDEPGDRNRMLEAGRAIGGTHFVVLDADEAFTSNLLTEQRLKKIILSLRPGDTLQLNWIALWKSVRQYRHDQSVWSNKYKPFVFCDDQQCFYSSEFIHTPRVPNNLKGRAFRMEGYACGVLHFQFVNWRNLLLKQAWYRCLERIRDPQKPAAEINKRYAPSTDETGLHLEPSPSDWFSLYPHFDAAVFDRPDNWRIEQIQGWLREYGIDYFRELDIWDVVSPPPAAASSRQGYLVSAIVSTYNAEAFMRGCLEDLTAQTLYKKGLLEIVVVNSGSQQNEDAIIREFAQRMPHVKYIRTEQRETVYAAWNRGIKASSGKHITNANTDDRHSPEMLETLAMALESDPQTAYVYSRYYVTEIPHQTWQTKTPVGISTWVVDHDRRHLLNKYYCGPQPMWRRSLHDEYGYFDERFRVCGDYEFVLRISQTHRLKLVPGVMGLYWRNPQSLERSAGTKEQEKKFILDMYRQHETTIIRRPLHNNQGSISKCFFTHGRSTAELSMRSIRAACGDAEPVIVIANKPNVEARRYCLENVKTTFFFQFDDDFFLHPQAVAYMERRLNAMEDKESVGLYYCHLWDDANGIIKCVKIYNADAIKSIGGFQFDELGREDRPTNAKLKESGYRLVLDPSIVAIHAIGGPEDFVRSERIWKEQSPHRQTLRKDANQLQNTARYAASGKPLEAQYEMRLEFLESLNRRQNTPFYSFLQEATGSVKPTLPVASVPAPNMAHKTRGIIYVVFGEEYDKVAAHTACYSRRFTNLPICVLTNLTERSPKWQEVSGVEFCHISQPDDSNREIRTSLVDYTPFDETLVMDVDAVIRKPGIERLFDELDTCEMAFVKLMDFAGCTDDFFKTFYQPFIETFSIRPQVLASGAIYAFKKSEFTRSFFRRWNGLWTWAGRTRDMPALMGTIETLNAEEKPQVKVLSNDHRSLRILNVDIQGICRDDSEAIIHHRYKDAGNSWYQRYGIPLYAMNKPWDKTDKAVKTPLAPTPCREDRRIALIVSIPERANELRQVICAIQPQVDEIRLWLNGFTEAPQDLSRYNKISRILTSPQGELLAGGVWNLLRPQDNGYILIVDDDIVYPSDYAAAMTGKIEQYHRKAAVAVHGINYRQPYEDCLTDRIVYDFRKCRPTDSMVHCGGVGTLCFHTDTLKPQIAEFSVPQFRDLSFAILSRQQNVPIVCIARPEGWLKEMGTQGRTIFQMSHLPQWRLRKNEIFRTELVPLLREPKEIVSRTSSAAQSVISVSMPTYNAAHYISAAIDSVLAQTFGDLELIVVDDGSTDDTVKIVESRRDPRIRLIRQQHQYTALATNNAIRHARGEFIISIDSDDRIEPDYFERLVQTARQYPQYDYYYPRQFKLMDAKGRLLGQTWDYKDFEDNTILPAFLFIHGFLPIPHPGSLKRRSMYERTGLYRDLQNTIDYDFMTRNALQIRFKRADNATGYHYRRHAASISLKMVERNKNIASAMEAMLTRYPPEVLCPALKKVDPKDRRSAFLRFCINVLNAHTERHGSAGGAYYRDVARWLEGLLSPERLKEQLRAARLATVQVGQ